MPEGEAIIGMGSNLGARLRYLRAAVAGLGQIGTVAVVSPLYETAPVGGPNQGPYLNAVAVLETDREPGYLLDRLLALERAAGRRHRERWAARTLDLDVLLHHERQFATARLIVPHPRIIERRFVLEPLLAVRPEARMPWGEPLAPFLAAVMDQDVRRVSGPGWAGPPRPPEALS